MQSLEHEPRHRSLGFLEHDGERWSCFLVTYPDDGDRWHGYFSFRSADSSEEEVRTADIFIEDCEAEIDLKARGMGRPLLGGLLSSALHTRESADSTPGLRRWFRKMLAENSRELVDGAVGVAPDGAGGTDSRLGEDDGLAELRSLYASYRLDQVAHFISLVHPDDFREAVARILDGTAFDFGARDRLQFAMMVVEYIESRLPLPPFEVWAEDYLRDPDAYARYAHALHREGRLG